MCAAARSKSISTWLFGVCWNLFKNSSRRQQAIKSTIKEFGCECVCVCVCEIEVLLPGTISLNVSAHLVQRRARAFKSTAVVSNL